MLYKIIFNMKSGKEVQIQNIEESDIVIFKEKILKGMKERMILNFETAIIDSNEIESVKIFKLERTK